MRHTDIATRWIPLVGCPRQRGDAADLQRQGHLRINVRCVRAQRRERHADEANAFRSGDWAASNSALIDAKAERSEIGVTRDRLRVMIWKSANFTLSVTVRPLTPVVSQ